MVFEGQTQFRKAQNMAALLALIILIGVILPIPIGAGFADWMNSVNAPVEIDDKYTEINTFDMDDAALEDGTGYKPYFYWVNASGDQQKHSVYMNGGFITAANVSKDDDQAYIMVPNYEDVAEALLGDDSHVEWEGNPDPHWIVYFNYTAKDAYEDNVVRMKLNITSASESDADLLPSNVTIAGKGLISCSEDDATRDKETCTVTFTAEGMDGTPLYKKTLSADGDGDVEELITIDTNWLREAVMNEGATSFFKLEIWGHDIRDVDISDSEMQSYNVNRLFGRDDGLYLVAMISVISAALGIFLVQPRYSLPIGNTGTRKRRGY